ncbi:MAG: TonB family protein [Leptolyngbyaceae cyanobacterium CSU_1_4]|nr:TonB family protein [Leptolyngbyaceae cyanobacterium CSU_1_4]
MEGGVPGGIIAPPIVTAPLPPAIEEQSEPLPELTNTRQAICRRCPSPDYPRTALQAGVEGRVQMAVDVDDRGRIIKVRLANSSGNSDIDRAVLETVRERWRFEEMQSGANNIPVEVYMTLDESELNRRAQNWGDRTVVEIPSSGFAAPPVAPDTPTTSRSEPSLSAPQPTVEPTVEPIIEPIVESIVKPIIEPTEPVVEPNVTSDEPPIAPTPQLTISLPEPILETVSEPERLPIELPDEPVSSLSEETLPDAIAPMPAPLAVDESP